MIVICGEHTEASPGMSAEIRIAQEEKTPYFLLWGRRESLCTKPTGAKSRRRDVPLDARGPAGPGRLCVPPSARAGADPRGLREHRTAERVNP